MNDVALFESALRAAVPTRPDPRIEADLVRRLAAVARSATVEAELRPRRHARPRSRAALVARVAAAVAAIPLAFAGLAVAGVHVPQPARDAFDSIGIELPNQPSEHSQAPNHPSKGGGGNDVSDAAKSGPSSEQGNSAAAHRHALDQRGKARGKAIGHDKGKAIGLNELTPPGQSKPHGSPTQPQHSGSSVPSDPGSAGDSHSSAGSDNSGANVGGADLPLPPQASGNAASHAH